jgi:hypothetical protein
MAGSRLCSGRYERRGPPVRSSFRLRPGVPNRTTANRPFGGLQLRLVHGRTRRPAAIEAIEAIGKREPVAGQGRA